MARIGVLLAACICCGCGAPSVAGEWMGRVAPAHFAYLELRLTQDGSSIRGTACYEELPGSSVGGVIFDNVPVFGSYPKIALTAPSANRFTFSGAFEGADTIKGEWSSATSAPYPMELQRDGVPAGTRRCFAAGR